MIIGVRVQDFIGWPMRVGVVLILALSHPSLAAPFPSSMRDQVINYCLTEGGTLGFCVCLTNRLEASMSIQEVQAAIDAIHDKKKPDERSVSKYREAVNDCR